MVQFNSRSINEENKSEQSIANVSGNKEKDLY